MFSQAGTEKGAYGLRIAGVESPRLGPALPEWPELRVVREQGADPDAAEPGTVVEIPGGVRVWIAAGGRIDVDRDTLTVTIRTPEPVSDDGVLHPYLALPAAFAGLWLGRLSLHGGAFLHDGGAWAVLGDKQGGKSSTLAALLGRGHAALSDDVLVLEGRDLFAGPRAVDLRDEAAALLGGEALGVIGARERWRLDPGPVPPVSELRGFVHLAWGDAVAVSALPAAGRLPALAGHCVLRPGPDQALALLELAALPSWRLERPRRIDAIDACVDQLLGVL